MYTKESLRDVKYGELLKISKSLGIKGGRQKTEKLINSILNYQVYQEKDTNSQNGNNKAENVAREEKAIPQQEEMLDDIQFPENSFSESSNNSPLEEASYDVMPKKRLLRQDVPDGKKEQCEEEERRKSSVISVDKRNLGKRSGTFSIPRKSLKRSNTFTLSQEENTTKPSGNIMSIQCEKSLKRSATFTKSQSKKVNAKRKGKESKRTSPNERKSGAMKHYLKVNNQLTANDQSQSLEGEVTLTGQEPKPLSTTSENCARKIEEALVNDRSVKEHILESPLIDLSCHEFQTAKDIQNLEINPELLIMQSKPKVRRSLRGQLLEARLSQHQLFSQKSQSEKTLDLEEISESEEKSNENDENKVDLGYNKSSKKLQNSDTKKARNLRSHIPKFVSPGTNKRSLRMPNFTKIHEKAFDQMEGLDDYIERKCREKALGSSSKKIKQNEPVFKPSAKTIEEICLSFTETKSPSNESSFNSGRKVSKKDDKFKTPKSQSSLIELTSMATKELQKGVTYSRPKRGSTNIVKQDGVSELTNLTKENVPPATRPWNSPKKDPVTTPGALQRRKNYNPTEAKCKYKPYTGSVKPLLTRDSLKKMANKNPRVKTRLAD